MAFLLFSDVILKPPVTIILDSRIGRENIQTLATLYPNLDKGNTVPAPMQPRGSIFQN